jgi:hypothetical protein
MKQTAVDWLHEEYKRILKDNDISVLQALKILDKYNQAKEMEKEQIENIFDDGYAMKYIHGEQYYKKTYGDK